MSYRTRRKFTSSTFAVGDHLCKVFLEPRVEYRPGYWLWNTGFAVGKSQRQLNDWYWRRNNRRRRSLDGNFKGKVGIKAIRRGFLEVLRLRWALAPGDVLVIDSTSGHPAKQFAAFSWWRRYHPEWTVNEDSLEFFWHRPPYPDDSVWDHFEVMGITPPKPLENTADQRYFDCFLVRSAPLGTVGSSHRIADLLAQAQSSEPLHE